MAQCILYFGCREADIKPDATPTDSYFRFKKNFSTPPAPAPAAEGDSAPDDSELEFKYNLRIRIYDIIRVPTYARVWEVGKMGEDAAANCKDFDRHEWKVIRKQLDEQILEEAGKISAVESSNSLFSEAL